MEEQLILILFQKLLKKYQKNVVLIVKLIKENQKVLKIILK